MAVMGESKVGRGKKSLLRHLGFPRPPLVLDRVLVHRTLKAFLESAGAALVAVSLVYRTLALHV